MKNLRINPLVKTPQWKTQPRMLLLKYLNAEDQKPQLPKLQPPRRQLLKLPLPKQQPQKQVALNRSSKELVPNERNLRLVKHLLVFSFSFFPPLNDRWISNFLFLKY